MLLGILIGLAVLYLLGAFAMVALVYAWPRVSGEPITLEEIGRCFIWPYPIIRYGLFPKLFDKKRRKTKYYR